MKGVPIRKDLIDIQRRDNKIAEYWALPNLKYPSDALSEGGGHEEESV